MRDNDSSHCLDPPASTHDMGAGWGVGGGGGVSLLKGTSAGGSLFLHRACLNDQDFRQKNVPTHLFIQLLHMNKLSFPADILTNHPMIEALLDSTLLKVISQVTNRTVALFST